jgi:cytochrome c
MRASATAMAIGALAAVLALMAAPPSGPDPNRGRELFEKRCTGCHALDKAKEGPPLRGVFGRAAAGDPHFPYSDALKGAHVTWDEATLDKWLTDTESVVPQNDMTFRLENAAERADIIAYLKRLSSK